MLDTVGILQFFDDRECIDPSQLDECLNMGRSTRDIHRLGRESSLCKSSSKTELAASEGFSKTGPESGVLESDQTADLDVGIVLGFYLSSFFTLLRRQRGVLSFTGGGADISTPAAEQKGLKSGGRAPVGRPPKGPPV